MNSCTIPSDRYYKAGWHDTHRKHKSIVKASQSEVIFLGDSIVAGLSRYPNVWSKYFGSLNALNLGISGDRTQHVLWRARNLVLTDSVKYVVIHCGTNNVDANKPDDIADGIIEIGLSLRKTYPHLKFLLTSLLPRDYNPTSLRRSKMMKTNEALLKKSKNLKNLYFMKQVDDWIVDGGFLDTTLYYSDHLHLVENGYRKFACTITNLLNTIHNEHTTSPTIHPITSPVLCPVTPSVSCSVSCSAPCSVNCNVSCPVSSCNDTYPASLPSRRGASAKPKWEKCWYVHRPSVPVVCPTVPIVRKSVSKRVNHRSRFSKPVRNSNTSTPQPTPTPTTTPLTTPPSTTTKPTPTTTPPTTEDPITQPTPTKRNSPPTKPKSYLLYTFFILFLFIFSTLYINEFIHSNNDCNFFNLTHNTFVNRNLPNTTKYIFLPYNLLTVNIKNINENDFVYINHTNFLHRLEMAGMTDIAHPPGYILHRLDFNFKPDFDINYVNQPHFHHLMILISIFIIKLSRRPKCLIVFFFLAMQISSLFDISNFKICSLDNTLKKSCPGNDFFSIESIYNE